MIKLENAKISMLINQDGTTIKLYDSKSAKTFAVIKLTNDQLASMLSRLSHTECSIELFGLENINKRMKWEYFDFEIDKQFRRDNPALNQKCIMKLKEKNMTDWIPDNYYGSQNSFFEKDGKYYAKVVIRRWI